MRAPVRLGNDTTFIFYFFAYYGFYPVIIESSTALL